MEVLNWWRKIGFCIKKIHSFTISKTFTKQPYKGHQATQTLRVKGDWQKKSLGKY